MRRRVAAAAVLIAVVGAGLVVHLALPDTAATDIAGDALYPLAVYAALAFLAPRLSSAAVGATTLAWCVIVELLQLTPLPQAAASVVPPAVLVLGTVFDPRDLAVYVIATIAATLVDLALRRVVRRGVRPRAR